MKTNYAAVFIAAIAYWLLGAVWYGVLFSKPWMALENISIEQAKSMNPVLPYVITFVLNLLIAYALAQICIWRNAHTVRRVGDEEIQDEGDAVGQDGVHAFGLFDTDVFEGHPRLAEEHSVPNGAEQPVGDRRNKDGSIICFHLSAPPPKTCGGGSNIKPRPCPTSRSRRLWSCGLS